MATVYEAVGGDAVFRRLVDAFYARVADDPVLRPVFPADLEPGKERQFLFLTQYFGGPARYSAAYGHPRLRMRHVPFAIGKREAAAWLAAMLAAIDEIAVPELERSALRDYFTRSAPAMLNQQ